MKKLFTLLVLAITLTTVAQGPQGFNYQATVRNSAGALITNQIVGFKFSIKQTSASGTTVYSETQYVTPDNLGQVSLVVGTGSPSTTATFAAINWASGTYYLAIELNTGAGFVVMGTTQLLSVPYALYANSAGSTGDLQSQIATLQSQIDVLNKPQITTAPIGDLTSFSAVSGGAIISTGSGDISARGVVWGTSTNPTIALSTKTSDGSDLGSFTSVITGLSPNIKYYLRAYATNSNGTSYGAEVSFTPQAEVTNSNNPNVFIDTFSGALNYLAFAGSDMSAFQIDNKEMYSNSGSSMRFDVPNVGDPAGGYAGGLIVTELGRDLSGYNVLTYWAKGQQAATIEIGFGLDDKGSQDYKVSCTQKISTGWKKYYLPIPDASKLQSEKGLLYVSAGAKDTDGYTFWIDEVKYENLVDVILQEALINSGGNTTSTGPAPLTIGGLTTKFRLPNEGNQVVNTSPNYYNFISDNPAVATIDSKGVVEKLSAGTTNITATLGNQAAVGSIQVISYGVFVKAPIPSRATANVVSVFSDKYTNINIDFFNGYWQPYQTTLSNDFEINGDKFLRYTNFNFVGNQFANPLVDLSQMTHLHFNMYIPVAVPSNFDFKVTVVDFGPNGKNDGTIGDDTRKQLFVPKSDKIKANEWITIELPLNMSTKNKVGLIIYENINVSNVPALKEFYMDNVYFYKE
jgi:hypothetical protein